MLANIHVYVLTAVTMFFLLSKVSQLLDVAFLFPVSIYISLTTRLDVHVAGVLAFAAGLCDKYQHNKNIHFFFRMAEIINIE